MFINWNSGGYMPRTNNTYLLPNGINAIQNQTQIYMPKSGTLYNLNVGLSAAPNTGPTGPATRTFTIYDGPSPGGATSLSVMFSGTTTSLINNTNTVSVTQGDLISIYTSVSGPSGPLDSIGYASVQFA
jgi:hypothetical protein